MKYQPGEIISVKQDVAFYVYALIDDDGQVFYIGRSSAPWTRLQQHASKAATPMVRAKLATVREARMLILGGPMSEDLAARTERICITAGLAFFKLANYEAQPVPPQRGRAEYIERFLRGVHGPRSKPG